jgi:hypothetical protein
LPVEHDRATFGRFEGGGHVARIGWVLSVCVGLLAASRASGADAEHRVDLTGQLSPRGVAALDGRAGAFVFRQVLLRNMPREDELQKAKAHHRARPRPQLVVTYLGTGEAEFQLELRLEDDQGNSLLSCTFKGDQDPGRNEIVSRVCSNEEMPLLDWPRVRVVRVVGTVRQDD